MLIQYLLSYDMVFKGYASHEDVSLFVLLVCAFSRSAIYMHRPVRNRLEFN